MLAVSSRSVSRVFRAGILRPSRLRIKWETPRSRLIRHPQTQAADFRGSNADFREYTSSLGSRIVASTRTAVIREHPRTIRENPRPRFFGTQSVCDRVADSVPHTLSPARRSGRAPFGTCAVWHLRRTPNPGRGFPRIEREFSRIHPSLGSRIVTSKRTAVIREYPRTIRENPRPRFFRTR